MMQYLYGYVRPTVRLCMKIYIVGLGLEYEIEYMKRVK